MNNKILLAHGGGGRLSHDLVGKKLLPMLFNPILGKLDDAAVFDLNGRLAFTTDSYVVRPMFFPGGDIGRLAVYGTVNDLAMCGASPRYISLALIIEEGLDIDDLDRVLNSVSQAAKQADVEVVTGDTKVVNRGGADKLYINTAGIGVIPQGVDISGVNARPGDKVILSGDIGQHGIAVMSQREGFHLKIPVQTDCAPLHTLVKDMLGCASAIHCLRDPTRGGLAASLNELAMQSGVGITIEEDKVSVDDSVRAACELLGFDPLYIANEGRLVAIVASGHAEQVLDIMRHNQYGAESQIIGEVVAEHTGKVVMKTLLGASRIVDMPSGELLPRIC